MAGRIRTIKPEILDDEIAAGLSDSAWRLWVSSWLLADDHGRLRGNPSYLRGTIWWHENHSSKPIQKLIHELHSAGLLVQYEVGSQKYALVPNWKRHQRVDKPGKPRVPGPSETLEKILETPGKIRECLATDHDHDHDHIPTTPTPTGRRAAHTKRASHAVAEGLIGDFNRYFGRSYQAVRWTELVTKALKAGYTQAEIKGAFWGAAQSCSGSPEVLANFTPKSVLRLRSRGDGTTLPEWVEVARQEWEKEHPGKPNPWDRSEASDA